MAFKPKIQYVIETKIIALNVAITDFIYRS